jgi:hypothetical protein
MAKRLRRRAVRAAWRLAHRAAQLVDDVSLAALSCYRNTLPHDRDNHLSSLALRCHAMSQQRTFLAAGLKGGLALLWPVNTQGAVQRPHNVLAQSEK